MATVLIRVISSLDSRKEVAKEKSHELGVSFVTKPNHCIWFFGQSWPVVSSVKGWMHKMVIKMMTRVLAEWDTAWRLPVDRSNTSGKFGCQSRGSRGGYGSGQVVGRSGDGSSHMFSSESFCSLHEIARSVLKMRK